jgi:hypothetical protein
MRVATHRRQAIIISLIVAWSVVAPRAWAQELPPEATPTMRGNLPAETCSAAEIAAGDADIVERPVNGALVEPAATPGRSLYLLELTLPPNTCVGYSSHYLHDGAIVWFVQEGEIEFSTQPIAGTPPALVTAMDHNQMPIATSSMPITLGSGDWVALDRAAEYTYRNAGAEPAIVLMAANEDDPFARSCKGGCRKR